MKSDRGNRLAKPLENGLADAPGNGGGPETVGPGLPEPKTPLLGNARAGPTMATWQLRDDFLRTCVRLGLNAKQISDLSLSSPQPLHSTQRVFQKIESEGLRKLWESRKVDDRRKGFHNREITATFMKLCGQAMEYGYAVTEVLRDEAPDGVRFRPDLGLKLGSRQFYVEVQVSRLEYTRWSGKLLQYFKLYKLTRAPFRALLLVNSHDAELRVRDYARRLLKRLGHPDLNLFLTLPLGDFQRAADVLKAPVWATVWSGERIGLM